MTKAEQIVSVYSAKGRTSTELSSLSIEEQRQAVRALLRDTVIKVEGTANPTATAKSKSKGKGQKVISVGKTQGLRTLEGVAKSAGLEQYIPALQYYDKAIKTKEGGAAIEKPRAGGWKDGKPQTVQMGDGSHTFKTEADYLQALYSRLETFQTSKTGSNKKAMAYYRDQLNRGLRALGMQEIDESKAKTAKTLFGFGATSGTGAFQRLGTQTQQDLKDYWKMMREQINKGDGLGYESETVIQAQVEAQEIAATEGKTRDEANSWFIDAMTINSKIPATIADLKDRVRMVAGFQKAEEAREAAGEEEKEEDKGIIGGMIEGMGNIDLSGMPDLKF